MTNTFANSTIVAKEALAILKNMIGFAKNVNRDYEDEFKENKARGYSPGQTINIKRPPRYTYRAGRVAQPQPTVQSTTPLTLSQGGADLYLTNLQRTLEVTSNTGQSMLTAAMATIVNEIDLQGLMMAKQTVFNAVGTPGTPPANQAAALQLILDANTKLDLMAAPRDGQRNFVMGPILNGQLVGGLAGLFNSQQRISQQYQRGIMVDSLGANFLMDQNVQTHTNGTQPVAGGTVAGAGQTGANLTVTGASITGTITKGSVFTIANVFAVNPQSRQSTGQLQQFVATADVAPAAVTIPISPAIVPTGQFQNVNVSPSNLAVITILGAASSTYTANIEYHKDAFTLAMVPMDAIPDGLGAKQTQISDDGFTLKYTQFYDGRGDEILTRFDVLFGWAATYPELATKVLA